MPCPEGAQEVTLRSRPPRTSPASPAARGCLSILLSTIFLLPSCATVESLGRTTRRVIGLPDTPPPAASSSAAARAAETADALPANEYAAACLRERRRLILEILELEEDQP